MVKVLKEENRNREIELPPSSSEDEGDEGEIRMRPLKAKRRDMPLSSSSSEQEEEDEEEKKSEDPEEEDDEEDGDKAETY